VNGLARLILVVAGFAATGELVLRRPSRSIAALNEAFWVGAGCFTALLVAGSAAASNVLSILFGALPLAVLAALWRRRTRANPAPHELSARSSRSLAGSAAFGIAAIATVVFAALNARTGYVTDGFDIWASKARVLSVEGRLERSDREPERLGRVASYPPLVPLVEAFTARRAGGFDFRAAKLAFPVFFVSLLAGTWGIARRFLGRGPAGAAVAVVAFLPAVSADWNAGGFADLALAAAAAAAAAAWLGRFTDSPAAAPADGWLAGAVLLSKPEGAVLVACGALVAAMPRRAARPAGSRRALLPLAGFAGITVFWRMRFGAPEGVYGPFDAAHLSVAAHRLGPVVRACIAQALSLRSWGLLWAAAAPAVAILAIRGRGAARRLAQATGLAASAYGAIFLFSNWGFPGPPRYGSEPLETHIALAFPRLLEQIAAPAAVVLLAAYDSLGRRAPAGSSP